VFKTVKSLATIMTAILLLIRPGVGFATEPSGSQEYQQNCARCHGTDGKGNGPDAKTLRGYHPANLTLIRRKNGGTFPRQEIYDVIDGGKRLPGHNDWNSPMPLWGLSFQLEGEEYSPESEAQVRRKITALIDYIESIQEK
jgi:cbb3-type cytochrome c oxidase subunit III